MGSQLWTSPLTGYRRKGTRFTALKKLFIDNITVRNIYEPLLCCPQDSSASSAKDALIARDFDVAGVKETEEGEVIGFIRTIELGEENVLDYVTKIEPRLLISDSTPISELFSILSEQEFSFVLSGNLISGIITRADINKPPVRIYLFGLLSLFEMHLNAWINHHFTNNSWTEKVPSRRMKKATNLYKIRKGNNQDLSLLECMQMCDKRNLLLIMPPFLEGFGFNGDVFDSFVKDVEKVRNEIAHSQDSIISNVDWTRLIEIISEAERFLHTSDSRIEHLASEGNDFHDILVPSV